MTDHNHRALPALVNPRLPSRQANRLMRPQALYGTGGRPGKLEEMIQSHMRVAARHMDVADMVSGQEWTVSPPDDPTPAEETFTKMCKALCEDMRQDVANDVGDLGESLAVAMGSVWFGHWVAENTLHADPTSVLGVRLEVYDIHVSTIASWDWENREAPDKLTGITQRTRGKGVKIPVESLSIITVGQPWPTGFPRLRPAVFWYATAKQVVMSFSEQARAASGLLIVTMSQSATKNQHKAVGNLIVDIQTEEGSRGVAVGGGNGVKDVSYHFPSAIFDPTVYLKYFDGQIDQLMMSSLQSLGLTAGSGSRSLGDTLEVADKEKWAAALNSLGNKWARAVFGWLAKMASGAAGPYKGRLPRLHVADAEVSDDPTEVVGNAVAAANAGLLEVDSKVRDKVKEVTMGWSDADDIKLSAFGARNVGRLTLRAGAPPLPPSPEFFASLRGMTKEELFNEGLANWDGTLMVFPKSWYSLIPEGFEVVDIFGQVEAFGAGTTDDDHRFGFLAFGVLADGATSYRDADMDENGNWLPDEPRATLGAANPDKGGAQADHLPACQCGAHRPLRFAKSPKSKTTYRLVDAWGDTFTSSKPLDRLSPGELGMKLGAWEDARADLDARVTESIANVTATVRGNVIEALDTLPDNESPRGSAAIADVLEDAKGRYRTVVEQYREEAQEITATLGAEERQAAADSAPQVSPTKEQSTAQAEEMGQWVEDTNAKIAKQVEGSVDRMASRVVGEMLDSYDADPELVRPGATYVTRLTDEGIAREAAAPITASENLGRIEQAIMPQPDGLVVTALTRTHVRDGAACQVCKDKDGYDHPEIGHVEFPRDLEKYRASSDFTFPDMTCLGREWCRCDVVITYGLPIAA